MTSARPLSKLAVVSALSAAVLSPAPASAAPSLTVTVRALPLCAGSCDFQLSVFECDALFLPGALPGGATNVAQFTGVECYAPGVNGAAPGMALTTFPGPFATSGGYASGPDGYDICVLSRASYFNQGNPNDVRSVGYGPVCKSPAEWGPL